jgi:hypothetical protein
MKKIILSFFLLRNLCFADTYINWKVEKTYNNDINVSCDLSGDIRAYFDVNVSPFKNYSSDGEDYNLRYDLSLKVEKDYTSRGDIAYYTCYLKKDYETLASYQFKVERVLIIEGM